MRKLVWLLVACAEVEPVDETMLDEDDVPPITQAWRPRTLAMSTEFAVNQQGASTPWSFGGTTFTPVFLMELYDNAGLNCRLIYGLGFEAFARAPAPGEPDPADGSLEAWLVERNLLYGLEVVPGTFAPTTVAWDGRPDCQLDPAEFTEDPHAALLGEGLFLGVKAQPSTAALDLWERSGLSQVVDPERLIGADVELSRTGLTDPSPVVVDMMVLSGEVDQSMQVQLGEDGQVMYQLREAVPADPAGVTAGWYRMITFGVYAFQ